MRNAEGEVPRAKFFMSPLEMQQLFEYNAWANRRSLSVAEKLTLEQFLQPMGSSFSSVRDTLAHIYGVERVWLERFRGISPPAIPRADQFNDVASLRESWLKFEPELLTYVGGLSQYDLDRVMEYKTLRFGEYRNPLWQSMLHLINHGSYHRGQVTTLLRQHGVQPVLTDLIHYYRERSTGSTAA
jgi:uncharacterized damage-inducible protein DinB